MTSPGAYFDTQPDEPAKRLMSQNSSLDKQECFQSKVTMELSTMTPSKVGSELFLSLFCYLWKGNLERNVQQLRLPDDTTEVNDFCHLSGQFWSLVFAVTLFYPDLCIAQDGFWITDVSNLVLKPKFAEMIHFLVRLRLPIGQSHDIILWPSWRTAESQLLLWSLCATRPIVRSAYSQRERNMQWG